MKYTDSNPLFNRLPLTSESEELSVADRIKELAAYETLFLEKDMTFLKVARIFEDSHCFNPSSLCSDPKINENLAKLKSSLFVEGEDTVQFTMRGEKEYPDRILEVSPSIQLLYYTGDVDLLQKGSIAIVGSRRASAYGIRLARRIAAELANAGYVIVSGLAQGIDVSAHQAAIGAGGRTLAVLGTPINQLSTYGRGQLAKEISTDHLVVSQVPVLRYGRCSQKERNSFFLARNATISAISVGTIVVEAEDISGSLSTARHALKQNKKLFIPASCFKNTLIKWPWSFKERGAIEVRNVSEILDCLA